MDDVRWCSMVVGGDSYQNFKFKGNVVYVIKSNKHT